MAKEVSDAAKDNTKNQVETLQKKDVSASIEVESLRSPLDEAQLEKLRLEIEDLKSKSKWSGKVQQLTPLLWIRVLRGPAEPFKPCKQV